MKYRAELDGLRAIAVISVILAHAKFEFFSGGFIGVDIFFVLSGFFITKIIHDEIKNNSFTLSNFYARRAKRILPALIFVILFTSPFALAWLLPHQLKDFSASVVAVSLFVSNFLLKQDDYFGLASDEKPLLHTWSLAVEEQYYLLFPIIFILWVRFANKDPRVFLVILGVSSLALCEWAWREYPTANFYLLPGRAWELMAGALVALTPKPNPSKINTDLGILMILASILIFNESTPSPSIYLLPAVIGTMLVIHYYDTESYFGRLLKFKYLVFIGVISYSAYLWHQPLFSLARIKLVREPSSLEYFLLILAILILSVFSWRFMETPFRKAKNLSRKYVLALSVSSMVVLITAGWYGYEKNGFPDRFQSTLLGDVGHDTFNSYLNNNFQNCSIKENKEPGHKYIRCRQNHTTTPDIIILGDSHAEHLYPGFVSAWKNKKITYFTAGESLSIKTKDFKGVLNTLEKTPPSHIFVSQHFQFRSKNKDRLYEEFVDVISFLKHSGHTVTLLTDVPWYKLHAANCVFTSDRKISRQCKIPMRKALAQEKLYLPTLQEIAYKTKVQLINVKAPLCTETECSMSKQNEIMYRDNNHLNLIGSNIIAQHIKSQIK